jgi:hypothetical protein
MPDFIYKGKVYYNPVQLVMEQIGGTWKAPILWRLNKNILRYGELRKDIPHISDKMLTTQAISTEKFIPWCHPKPSIPLPKKATK